MSSTLSRFRNTNDGPVLVVRSSLGQNRISNKTYAKAKVNLVCPSPLREYCQQISTGEESDLCSVPWRIYGISVT